MEGALVYIDENNLSTLLMYKEITSKKIFYVKYNFLEFKINYMDLFDFVKIIPANNIHILSSLPYINDININLNLWKTIALNKLNTLNRINNPTNFYYKHINK
tara:strand:+ start:701 stop:1009 length:309 start_codon:yes stop_codon:yes gene_type:complete